MTNESPARWLIGWNSSKIWGEWLEKGVIAYGWGERISDFNQYHSADDIQATLKQYNIDNKDAKQGATTYSVVSKEIWQFLHEMKIGDIVYVRGQRNKIVGMGKIASLHKYQPDIFGHEYANIREVTWISTKQEKYPSDTNTCNRALLNITSWVESGFLERLEALYDQAAIEAENKEITEVYHSRLQGATRETVVKARIGQGYFRDRLLYKYKKCCLCSVEHRELLRASHIKPWSRSMPDEQCDIENGLLLCSNHDALFDKGFISFDDNGHILISARLNENEKRDMNINSDMKIHLSEENKKYMADHRAVIFDKF